MVEMERRRLKGVLVKTEPHDVGLMSADSSEEMEMNDNGHVTEDEYSEMTYDDMEDFESLQKHVKGEQINELDIDKSTCKTIAGFAMKETTDNTGIEGINDAEGAITLDDNDKADICNIDQIDDIQNKAMDALSLMYPCNNGTRLTDEQYDEILKKTDEMFSDIETFAAYTDSNELVLKEADNENNTSLLLGDGLPTITNENNNDLDSIHSKHSEYNVTNEDCLSDSISAKDCSSKDQSLSAENNFCSVKTEKVEDQISNDKDPNKSVDAKDEHFYKDGRSMLGNEINLVSIKQEKFTENSLQNGDCRRSWNVISPERDQGADNVKKETVKPFCELENSELRNSDDKTLPEQDSISSASQADKRPKRYNRWRAHPYLQALDKQCDAVSNIQALCDTVGDFNTDTHAPTTANNLLNKNNLSNIQSLRLRMQLNAMNRLNRNGINPNLPAYPSTSNSQHSIHNLRNSRGRFPVSGLSMPGTRPQFSGVNRGPLNQSGHGYFAQQGMGNQSLNGQYRTSNTSANPLWNNAQIQQNNSQNQFAGNNSQRLMNRCSSAPGQSVNNNSNFVNSRPRRLDFQQSLDDFNVDLLGFGEAATSGSFNNASNAAFNDNNASYSAVSNQNRDMYDNRQRIVNSNPSNMCQRSLNQHNLPSYPVQGHSNNSRYPVQPGPPNQPPPYPHGPGQVNQLSPPSSYRTGSSDAAFHQPNGTVHHPVFNNQNSNPNSIQPFTPPRQQIGQSAFSGIMNASNINHNNLFNDFPLNR